MRKPRPSIPTNPMADEPGTAIALDRLVLNEQRALGPADPAAGDQATHAHREDRHAFFLLETGTIHVEIDFQAHVIEAPALVYMPPEQVHRIVSFSQITVSSLGITTDKLNPTYRPLLADLRPATPLTLTVESFQLLGEALALCRKFAARQPDKLYHALLQDSCNAVVALGLACYAQQAPPPAKRSQVEVIAKAFHDLLESQYATAKRPGDYAHQLHISTPYLNECVKTSTGYSVSQAIQQRVMLEAKRLLYHSQKSVKEIAAELGYADYPYFCRLFTKVVGMTALTFRGTRLD